MSICKIDGCGNELCRKTARGYCSKHYKKYLKYGDATVVKLGRPLDVRFWEKVKKTSKCWEWLGRKNKGGYGIFTVGHTKKVLAHRMSWKLTYGEEPGKHCLHECDNPSCVNPNHLFIGTQADNCRDMWNKGRGKGAAKGEKSVFAKLTDNDVKSIRNRYIRGNRHHPGNIESLADEYGISKSYAYKVARGYMR